MLVDEHTNISQEEAADIEAKELGGMTCAELKPNMSLRRVLEARILYLASDLI